MHIIAHVARWFDWVPESEQPSDEDIAQRRVKPDQAGKWTRRVLIDAPSHVKVNLPEAEIVDCQAHFERVERPKDRAELVRWYLADTLLPLHAPRDAWRSIEVPGEPEVEAYVNQVLKLGGAQ